MKNPELGKRPEQKLFQESRFGNKAEVCHWLEEGNIEEKIKMEDVMPKLKGRHSNVVELAILPQKEQEIPSEYIYAKGDKTFIRGVFKPFWGESALNKGGYGFDAQTRCYKREVMAYLIDATLGFDIVPPTVERSIGKQNDKQNDGSIQLFIPPELADWGKDISGLNKKSLRDSQDYYKIAILDYILQNPDRKPENYLVSLDGQKCFAIDHGYILPPKGCSKRDIIGPRNDLKDKPIPKDLLSQLDNFVKKQNEITQQLSQSVIDLRGIFERVSQLIRAGKIL